MWYCEIPFSLSFHRGILKFLLSNAKISSEFELNNWSFTSVLCFCCLSTCWYVLRSAWYPRCWGLGSTIAPNRNWKKLSNLGIEKSLMVFHLLVKMQIEPPQGKRVEFTLKAKQAFSHIEIFKSTQKTRSSKNVP